MQEYQPSRTQPATRSNTDPVQTGEVCWQSPSNIALTKYWGKKPVQIPANPSVSFTLREARTITGLQWQKKEKPSGEDLVTFRFLFHGREKPEFRPKLEAFFQRILPEMPFLSGYRLDISSENTFPHSSGIASSASAMSALAAALTDMEDQVRTGKDSTEIQSSGFRQRASFLSRLGSGSACRSLFPEAALWGKTEQSGSSDTFAIGLAARLHPEFHDFHDDILLIDRLPKSVTSTAGHGLMIDHPFAKERFKLGYERTSQLLRVLETGDLGRFIEIVESEALMLHALMMTSDPSYILLRPGTIAGIEKIRRFRRETGIPVSFTLDAGPNIHLLYPDKHTEDVRRFIRSELSALCEKGLWIADRMGRGSQKLPHYPVMQ